MAELGKPKLADALKGTSAENPGENLEAGRPEDMGNVSGAGMKIDNAQVNEGIQTREERLVLIGRGHLAAGRRPEHDHRS
ncbi:MAG TPA: hypothetical protein VF590_21695 [Isosphaeraceae bacterium]|jgi:hypothetical protein